MIDFDEIPIRTIFWGFAIAIVAVLALAAFGLIALIVLIF